MQKRNREAQIKDDHHDIGLDDRLSLFSDDILASILSRMPPKDAAVTSKLSRRWRHLWHQTVRLNFVYNEILLKMARNSDLCWPERKKYIYQVNRVILQHKSTKIEEFKICFDLDKHSKHAINNWIVFAISKNVQTLELDLRNDDGFHSNEERNYVLPNYLFDKISGYHEEIKYLKTLILKSVNVKDEGLSKILSNCLVLEHLSIHESYYLVNIIINGKTLALKNLEFRSCYRLEFIEICDSNIVSFSCVGSPVTLSLNNLPNLEKITICEEYLSKKNNMFCQVFCCFSHLQVLQLNLLLGPPRFPFPELPKLKHLILNVHAHDEVSLLQFTPLVEACPNLLKFTIQLRWVRLERSAREVRYEANHPHQHLKMVEIDGYHGWTSDLELAVYFMENGIALKKIVIDPREVTRIELPEDLILEQENAARYCAEHQLKPRTPAGVELVIL